MSQESENLKSSDTWIRFVYILLFIVIFGVTEMVIYLTVFIQFLFVLFTGKRNERILKFGNELSIFAYDIFQYITYNSDEKPFPFGEWKEKIQ